jgi:hypothetical protein
MRPGKLSSERMDLSWKKLYGLVSEFEKDRILSVLTEII